MEHFGLNSQILTSHGSSITCTQSAYRECLVRMEDHHKSIFNSFRSGSNRFDRVNIHIQQLIPTHKDTSSGVRLTSEWHSFKSKVNRSYLRPGNASISKVLEDHNTYRKVHNRDYDHELSEAGIIWGSRWPPYMQYGGDRRRLSRRTIFYASGIFYKFF